ncbi:hypothetical protein BJV82DRAFT_555722 [Fennellomyces sp. T-0311]|nr:hypothetical protein BJV82DRAFT_555722 [Fennellomyces sp. T-0311]
MEENGTFRSHCKQQVDRWVNIGYVRKSNTKESVESRCRLLDTMATRLINRCFCTKIFASAVCPTSQALFLRDCPVKKEIMDRLSMCNGTTQDLFSYLSNCNKNVRLCIIDFAGLSTDPADITSFLKYVN